MISNLRDRPEFSGTVADRIWRAFWKKDGHPLSLLTGLVQQSLGGGPVPTALVAHNGDRFLGTVSVIACDENSRPQYTPWIAALWVEPDARERGIGAALVERAVEMGFATGAERLYLLAGAQRRAFYEVRGWTILEQDVPRPGMFILTRSLV